jgi:hypothetical protein
VAYLFAAGCVRRDTSLDNLTAAWLSALTPPKLRLSFKLRSIRKSRLGASKIRRRLFVHAEHKKRRRVDTAVAF